MATRTKRTAKTRSTHDSAPAALTAVQRRELIERPLPPLSSRVPGKPWGGAYINALYVDPIPHAFVGEDEELCQRDDIVFTHRRKGH